MKWAADMVVFEQAFEDQTSGQKKIQRGEYLSEGALPVIDQGQKPIAGYTNDLGNAYQGPLPVILFGDHTLAFKYVDAPFALGADGVRVLAAKPPFLSKFLFYYLNSVRIQSRGYSRHFKYLREVKFPHIPEKEQRRIVELLEQADKLRRQRAEADQLADRILPALFHKMFGRLFKEYKTVPLSSLVEEFRYGTSNRSADNGKPTLRIPNVVGGQLDLSELKLVPVSEDEFSRLRLLAGDLLFVRTNGNPDYVGRCAIFEPRVVAGSGFPSDEFIFASYLIRARSKRSLLNPYFVRQYLMSPVGKALLRERSRTSAGQFNINTEGLGNLPIPAVPVNEQGRFANFVQSFGLSRVRQYEARSKIDNLFATMLHRAFTGELTAKWREAHLKELLAEMEQQARLLRATKENN